MSAYEAGSEYGLVELQRERSYRLSSAFGFVLKVAIPEIRNCAFQSRVAVSVPLAGFRGLRHLLPRVVRVVVMQYFDYVCAISTPFLPFSSQPRDVA